MINRFFWKRFSNKVEWEDQLGPIQDLTNGYRTAGRTYLLKLFGIPIHWWLYSDGHFQDPEDPESWVQYPRPPEGVARVLTRLGIHPGGYPQVPPPGGEDSIW